MLRIFFVDKIARIRYILISEMKQNQVGVEKLR